MTAALPWVAALVAAWIVTPMLAVALLPGVPAEHKRAAVLCLAGAALRSLVVLPFSLSAPLVVWLPLLFTPAEADRLAFWDGIYGSDDDLNGDAWYVEIPPTGPTDGWTQWVLAREGEPGAIKMSDPKFTGYAYYADGHSPRSLWARYVWIGLRNRASRLAVRLGHIFTAEEQADRQSWGDIATGRSHEGWVLNRAGALYQLYACRKLGALCLRTNVGLKVGEKVPPEGTQNADAMVVYITASLLSWEGS